jgi:hypothetical protein
MTKDQIDQAIQASGSRISRPMRGALDDILLRRMTWREASIKRNVTESGILRALRRLGLR